jgi:hypothetical protein
VSTHNGRSAEKGPFTEHPFSVLARELDLNLAAWNGFLCFIWFGLRKEAKTASSACLENMTCSVRVEDRLL